MFHIDDLIETGAKKIIVPPFRHGVPAAPVAATRRRCMAPLALDLPENRPRIAPADRVLWACLARCPSRKLTLRPRVRFRDGQPQISPSGGIGWALPAAVGIQLADMSRPVCALIGDGSSMYSIQALWTAAHLKLPITYIITNNASYRILKQRLLSFHGNNHFIGMDLSDPHIDFAAMARSMGVAAERITEADAVVPALEAACANPEPNLLNIAVDGRVGG